MAPVTVRTEVSAIDGGRQNEGNDRSIRTHAVEYCEDPLGIAPERLVVADSARLVTIALVRSVNDDENVDVPTAVLALSMPVDGQR